MGMPTDAPTQSIHPLNHYLGYQLRRAASFMQTDLANRLSEVDLTMVEMSALMVIETNPLVTQSEIGRMLAIQRANMAPLTAVLSGRGLIEKKAVDGRSQGLSLTDKGREVVGKVRELVDANEARLFAHVPEKERQKLVALLSLVWDG
jgi:DNA-binding MarR family transcriptional regulator